MDDFDARRASLDLVTAFVNNNKLSAAELPTLLGDVFKAISGFDTQTEEGDQLIATVAASEPAPVPAMNPEPAPTATAKPAKVAASDPNPIPETFSANEPAVSIEDSLADPNLIVSLITGEKFKMLKRHLTRHGLTEAEYRLRFNLPDDYPMVAPAYSKFRREVAKKIHANAKKAGSKSKPAEPTKPVRTRAVSAKKDSQKKSASPRNKLGTDGAASAPAAGCNARVEVREIATSSKDIAETSQDVTEITKSSPATAPLPGSVPQADLAKADKAPNKPVAQKSARKRRMARQPAAEKPSIDAATNLTPVAESKAAEARPATAKPAALESSKSQAGPATSEASAKTGNKRKKLSPVYS